MSDISAPNSARAVMFTRSLVLLLFMLFAAGVGHLAIPKLEANGGSIRPKLDSVIPKAFGNWKVDPNIVPINPSPDQVALIGEIYDETLSRTYVNDKGVRVMLSLAYGRNQSRRFQIHKPEVCYVGQGFRLSDVRIGSINVLDRKVPVMEMVATQGSRVEPITYWIRVGDALGRGWVEQNTIRAKYALKGEIPDGLLFRVSNISRGVSKADFELHQGFAADLIASVAKDRVSDILGDVSALENAKP